MAFVCEKITKNDREYFDTIGFTNMHGASSEARWWTIDRSRNIILICRGGVPYERFKGYQLYLNEEIIDIEAIEKNVGNRFDSNLEVHWCINRIEVPQVMLDGYEKEIRQIIQEAFTSFSYCNITSSQVKKVTVEINTELVGK